MELKDFVETSLLEILDGISNAQAKCNNGVVNPLKSYSHREKLTNINFDVAVTVTDSIGTDAGAKISVFSSSVGAGVKGIQSQETLTKIKFSVPVTYPESS